MRSLTTKLVLAFLIVGLTTSLFLALLAGRLTARAFGSFIDDQNRDALHDQLAAFYESNQSWDGLRDASRRGMGMPRWARGEGLPAFALADTNGQVIVPDHKYAHGAVLSPGDLRAGLPIVVDGQTVGTVLPAANAFNWRPPLEAFLGQVYRNLALIGLGATAIALALGILLADNLTRPLRELTAATRAVARGDLDQTVPVRSRDELGELAEAFNQMNADLARARDLRRQMTADIAHDLRTPLSVILGHSEALRDGILPPTEETLEIIHDEAQRLSRLVEDLRTLSLAEAGELLLTRRPASPTWLLQRVQAAYSAQAQQKGIALEFDAPAAALPDVDVDPDRIAQVLGNLLRNALRHTPTNGRIILSAAAGGRGVRLAIQDSGPGVPPADMEQIFNRFYRGDRSRHRQDDGGSGLGLAIARSIVEGHGGRIWAENVDGAGLRVLVELPRAAADGA